MNGVLLYISMVSAGAEFVVALGTAHFFRGAQSRVARGLAWFFVATGVFALMGAATSVHQITTDYHVFPLYAVRAIGERWCLTAIMVVIWWRSMQRIED